MCGSTSKLSPFTSTQFLIKSWPTLTMHLAGKGFLLDSERSRKSYREFGLLIYVGLGFLERTWILSRFQFAEAFHRIWYCGNDTICRR